MAVIFKCKMCGGDLNIQDGSPVTECEYCGTQQTVPSLDNEKKSNLFARANRLRFNNEFDKASGVFESIVAEFPEEAEAYWGLCLCKYGIEYVDDPATAKKVPTCHRTSFESIFDDSNFDLALEYADPVAHKLYREEAKEIDRLQKSILEIANKEEPFDVFICYKETAEDGQRTKDSVLAQDIYDALTAKGYKVFFARITLEDKLGQEYEPYIFAALNSAKVMLSVGTKYEYFNAVWVKNEWSRFLEMKKKHPEKVLIPCYADIDAYDMPQEFRNLQGQDMGKVGFLQDLVRGIGKIIPRDEEKPVQREVSVCVPLLRRAFEFLEDENWQSANEYGEKVLDQEPDNAEAYLVKLLARCQLHSEEDIDLYAYDITNKYEYKKLMSYATGEFKERLEFRFINAEDSRKSRIYLSAKNKIKSGKITTIELAIQEFSTIPDWKDAKQQINICHDEIKDIKYKTAVDLMKSNTTSDYDRAIVELKNIIGWRDSKNLINVCRDNKKDIEYASAVALMKNNNTVDYSEAIRKFEKLGNWRDSAEKIEQCNERIKCILEERHQESNARYRATISEKIENVAVELQREKKRLSSCRNILCLLKSLLCVLLMAAPFIYMVILEMRGGIESMGAYFAEDETALIMIGLYLCMVIAGVASIARLHDSGIIFASIIFVVTAMLYGILAAIINLIKDIVDRHKKINAQKLVVTEVQSRLSELQASLSKYCD